MKSLDTRPLHSASILKLIQRLWPHLSRRRKYQLGMVAVLMFVSALTEVISLGAVIPFLAVLANPALVFNYPAISHITPLLGISTSEQLILPIAAFFAAASLMAGAIRILQVWVECIFSHASGFDSLPGIFRRPIVYVDMVPLGYLFTFRKQLIAISKHHFAVKRGQKLTLREIFNHDVGIRLGTSHYKSKGIQLIENTPEEIRDVVIEMEERLNGTWQSEPNDDALQRQFWEIFPDHIKDPDNKGPLHGEIRARIGSHFLRNNSEFLK